MTTYSYSYCRGKQKALGYYSDLCAIRVLTEPCTITLDKQILFVKYKQTCKFGIESLGVESNKSTLNTASNPFKVNRVEYLTTADSATKSYTTGSSLSLSILGAAGITISDSETIDKCIVDVTDNSTRTKMALSFEFGKPKTTQQEERVYEQTYYYILQEYLSNRKEYTNSTTFTVVYNCDSKTSSKKMTVNTPLKFK